MQFFKPILNLIILNIDDFDNLIIPLLFFKPVESLYLLDFKTVKSIDISSYLRYRKRFK